MYVRSAVRDFALGNPIYSGAKVIAYGVTAGGAKDTSKFVTLYDAQTGGNEIANPQELDSDGKWKLPVYAEEPVILDIRPRYTPNHDTGIVYPSIDNQGITMSYAGDPDGSVAGLYVGQRLWDTTNGTEWTCTTPGAAASAVWQRSGRLTDVINVKDYGAVGDGIADDLPAYDLADAAGSPVYSPAGTYRVSTVPAGTSAVYNFAKDAKLLPDSGTWLPRVYRMVGNTEYYEKKGNYLGSNPASKRTQITLPVAKAVTAGETVTQAVSGATGIIAYEGYHGTPLSTLWLTSVTGTFDAINTVTGSASGSLGIPSAATLGSYFNVGESYEQHWRWSNAYGYQEPDTDGNLNGTTPAGKIPAGQTRLARSGSYQLYLQGSHNGQGDGYNQYSTMATTEHGVGTVVSWGGQNSGGLYGGQNNALSDNVNLYALGDIVLNDKAKANVSLLGNVSYLTYDGTGDWNQAKLVLTGEVTVVTGETLTQAVTGSTGVVVLGGTLGTVWIASVSGSFDTTNTLTGSTSGALGANSVPTSATIGYGIPRFNFLCVSDGAFEADAAYIAKGNYKTGIDLSGIVSASNQAIALAQDHKISFDATPNTTGGKFSAQTLGGVYMAYDGAGLLMTIGAGGTVKLTSAELQLTTTLIRLNGNVVLRARNTGWTAFTGSTDKATAYATSTVTLQQLAERVAAIQAGLTTHGLIGT